MGEMHRNNIPSRLIASKLILTDVYAHIPREPDTEQLFCRENIKMKM